MDVAFGYDYAMVNGKRTIGTDQSTAGSSGSVSGLPDNTGNSKLTGIGHGDFKLCFLSEWT